MTNAYILLKIFGRTPLLLVLNIHFVLFDKVWTLGNPLQQQIRCQYTFFSVASHLQSRKIYLITKSVLSQLTFLRCPTKIPQIFWNFFTFQLNRLSEFRHLSSPNTLCINTNLFHKANSVPTKHSQTNRTTCYTKQSYQNAKPTAWSTAKKI